MHTNLINKALKKYKTVSAIAAELQLNQSNLNKSVRSKKLSPREAHAIAKDLGYDEVGALYVALKHSARSEQEREYWLNVTLEQRPKQKPVM